ncbi:MAG: hypothetical protein ACYC3F_09615 [Gemmatimonadaceae bacterium]
MSRRGASPIEQLIPELRVETVLAHGQDVESVAAHALRATRLPSFVVVCADLHESPRGEFDNGTAGIVLARHLRESLRGGPEVFLYGTVPASVFRAQRSVDDPDAYVDVFTDHYILQARLKAATVRSERLFFSAETRQLVTDFKDSVSAFARITEPALFTLSDVPDDDARLALAAAFRSEAWIAVRRASDALGNANGLSGRQEDWLRERRLDVLGLEAVTAVIGAAFLPDGNLDSVTTTASDFARRMRQCRLQLEAAAEE